MMTKEWSESSDIVNFESGESGTVRQGNAGGFEYLGRDKNIGFPQEPLEGNIIWQYPVRTMSGF